MNPDGTGETRLTVNTDSDYSPRYSADGTKVAWGRESPNNSPVQVWTMNADGTNQVGPLTSEGSNNFVGDWSPDDTQIVFQSSRDGNFEIYKMNADGSGEVNLTDNAAPGANRDTFPTWSPDGTRVAFQSNRDGNPDIHVMNADGTNVENITGSSLAEESAPRWSPDGQRIAFTATGTSGEVEVEFFADQQRFEFTADIDEENAGSGSARRSPAARPSWARGS
jgi:TolB protein